MPKTTFAKTLKKGLRHLQPNREPFWKGPVIDGVTQSLLGRYLVCRERFRVQTVEGLTAEEGFDHRLEYGNMWHICEEYHGAGKDWKKPLLTYTKQLQAACVKSLRKKIHHWYMCCKTQFPAYIDAWKHHKTVKGRTSLYEELAFTVPYLLPSGRSVLLRGKFDGVDSIDNKELWLQENKCRGDVRDQKVAKQLRFDLQTLLYPIALLSAIESDLLLLQKNPTARKWLKSGKWTFAGVRYNVIRRPFSGGRGSIKQKEGQSDAEFYQRLADEYFYADPDYWFIRWSNKIDKEDLDTFKLKCLNPVLENLLDDYEWWSFCKDSPNVSVYSYMTRAKKFPHHQNRHYVFPYGVYNVLTEGGTTEFDEFVFDGSMVGLHKTRSLFPELN